MGIYRNISMSQRLDKISELLAKGIYLCLKKEGEKARKEQNEEKIKNNEVISADRPKNKA